MQIDFPDTSAVVRVLFMEKAKTCGQVICSWRQGATFLIKFQQRCEMNR